MLKGAAYIRVSTDRQDEYSPDAQKRLIYEYAEKNNINISPEHIYTEIGISGKKADKRPQFQQMIATCKDKEHPIDVILVWKFSRFARNQEESIFYKNMLSRIGIDVVSNLSLYQRGLSANLCSVYLSGWMNTTPSILQEK